MIWAVAKAVRAAITGSAGIAALVSTRVYLEQAAEGATLPYIVMNGIGGGSTNETPRDALDLQIQVKAVAADGASATTLERLIFEALHRQALSYDSPWRHLDCEHEGLFYFVENAERKQYHHAGGTYRIRASK